MNNKYDYHLTLQTVKDSEDFTKSAEFKNFSEDCDNYRESVLKDALENLTEEEKVEVKNWYEGEPYKEGRTENVQNAISYIISMGLG